ncbi:MAG: hypothetical protein BWY87_01343 [Deltaproteobacteria bacterium ADurb.Bin510]|nr:MAG: hypothetical protein BWY87_01343 [Deltaproteobacteria bacterium ADurb.Bin510]
MASLEVIGFFGDNEMNEGAACRILSGAVARNALDQLFVEEDNQ